MILGRALLMFYRFPDSTHNLLDGPVWWRSSWAWYSQYVCYHKLRLIGRWTLIASTCYKVAVAFAYSIVCHLFLFVFLIYDFWVSCGIDKLYILYYIWDSWWIKNKFSGTRVFITFIITTYIGCDVINQSSCWNS